MTNEDFQNDKVLKKVMVTIDNIVKDSDVKVISIVLYGSRASGDRNSMNNYDLLIFLSENVELEKFIQFNNHLKHELLKQKLTNVNFNTYTKEIFDRLLYNDKNVGAFLYIICRENIVLYDPNNAFLSILSRLQKIGSELEEYFYKNCFEFSKEMGSEKWMRKWEKALLQLNLNRKRKRI